MSSAARYRKKPVEIDALHLTESVEPEDAARWCGGRVVRGTFEQPATTTIAIDTLEGTMTASPGDWIIRGVSGEYYPCRNDIFEATYEAVDGA